MLTRRAGSRDHSFLNTFIISVVIFQMWNLLDLVLLDWFLLKDFVEQVIGEESIAGSKGVDKRTAVLRCQDLRGRRGLQGKRSQPQPGDPALRACSQSLDLAWPAWK